MTRSSRIEAVAFDLDGLLVNTEELYQHVGSELLRRRGKAFEPDLLDAMMGRPQKVSLAIMIEWHGLADTVEMLAAETGEIFVSLLDTQLKTMPGAVELLNLLDAQSIARGVATSSGPEFACDVLSRMGLLERFAFVLTSADVSQGKPHPEIYQTARGGWASSPAQCSCLKTRRRAARLPWRRGPWPWRCREATAGGTISPGHGSWPKHWPTRGSVNCWRCDASD